MKTTIGCKIRKGQGLNGGRLLVFRSLPSTNTWAMENIKHLAPGDVVTALTQTAGRGRFGRRWVSAENGSLSFSVALDRSVLADPALVSPCSALAVQSALSQTGADTKLKWPNDVMAGGKKICGILSETGGTNGLIITGIGLNVNVTSKDLEEAGLSCTATSLLMETGKRHSPDRLLAKILACMETNLRSEAETPGTLMRNWQIHDCLIGKNITVKTPNKTISGKYIGVDAGFRLIMEDTKGTQLTLMSGDVSLSEVF